MPNMGLVMEDGVLCTVDIDSIEAAETQLKGKVKLLGLTRDSGMYVLEFGALDGYEINYLATSLYIVSTRRIRKIFGPALVFGRIDSCGKMTEDPQDMPLRVQEFLTGRQIFETILMPG